MLPYTDIINFLDTKPVTTGPCSWWTLPFGDFYFKYLVTRKSPKRRNVLQQLKAPNGLQGKDWELQFYRVRGYLMGRSPISETVAWMDGDNRNDTTKKKTLRGMSRAANTRTSFVLRWEYKIVNQVCFLHFALQGRLAFHDFSWFFFFLFLVFLFFCRFLLLLLSFFVLFRFLFDRDFQSQVSVGRTYNSGIAFYYISLIALISF